MIALLAAQLMEPTTVPSVAEPSIMIYGTCAFSRMGAMAAERTERALKPRQVDAELAKCADAKALAANRAYDALANDPRFADPIFRKAWVANRLDNLHLMIRETALGRNDPDNWNDNAENK